MMRPSLMLSSFVALTCCLASVRSQEERTLQNSVLRVEQRLARLDDYLKSVQEGQQKQQKEKTEALQEARVELTRMRDLVKSQEAAFQQAEAERKAINEQKKLLEQGLQAANAKVEELNAQVQAGKKVLAQGDSDRKKAEADRTVLERSIQEAKTQHRELAQQLEASKKALAQKEAEQKKLAEARRLADEKLAGVQKTAKELRDQLDREQKERRSAEAAQQKLTAQAKAQEADLQGRTAAAKAKTDAARAEIEQLRAELEAMRADVALQQGDRKQVVEQLAAERRQIEQLRKDVAGELTAARRAAAHDQERAAAGQNTRDDGMRQRLAELQRENEELRAAVQQRELPGPGPRAGNGTDAARAAGRPDGRQHHRQQRQGRSALPLPWRDARHDHAACPGARR
jgi:chromosome segregation ATPase